MPINIPIINQPTPQAFIKILNLEGSQQALPESQDLMKGALAAYAVTQAGAQLFDHSVIGSLIYGLACAALLYGSTFYLLRFVKQSEKFVKTLMALAATGALGALAYMILHLVFGVALPPPLPTERLLRFLLFPIVVWNVFMFAFLYRHVSLRALPAFVVASIYLILIDAILSPLAK